MTALRQLRFSALKHVGQSLAHYKHYIENEAGRARQLDVGTIAHQLVLGGDQAVAVYEGSGKGKKPVRNGKVWEAFKAENAGKLIVIPTEYFAAKGCADAIRQHKTAMYLLEGQRELELKPWRIGDRECGGRVDCINPERRRIAELKTGASSEPWRFVRNGLRMGYHAQLAWYADGFAATGGVKLDEAFIVAVETKAPFVVTCFRVSERAIEMGRRIWRSWFEKLRVAEEGDFWPGYRQTTEMFDIEDDDEDFSAGLDFGGSELEEVA